MLADDAVPAPFTAGALLHGWEFPLTIYVPAVLFGVLYLVGYARVRKQPRPVFPPYRAWCFIASLVVLICTLDGPMDAYSDVDLAAHMGEHMILLCVVTPLFVLGAPATVALRAVSPAHRTTYILPVLHNRVSHVLTRPLVVGLLYAADMFATHFTGWYNLSLENEYIHDLEHLSYLVVAFLLWEVVIGVDPIRDRASWAQRILLVFLLMPVMAVIAVVFILANHSLYPYYVSLPQPWGGHAHAIANQGLAGAIMWIPSAFATLVAVIYAAVGWFREDEARQLRIEALEDAREHARS